MGDVINRFSANCARQTLADLPLSPANQRLAAYWLELWDGDEPPLRANFSPAHVRELLPGIMIQEVVPGRRVSIRLCGTGISQAFGRDLTGADLIALSPDTIRDDRLAYLSRVAEGAIGFAIRQATTRHDQPALSEELHLPLRDVTQDGGRLVLFHSDWRARDAHPGVAELPNVMECSIEMRALPLIGGSPVQTWSRQV